jgi:autotransporter translocation and assembly factor TamB
VNRRPFLVFAAVMALLIGGVISYLQGPAFARLAKGFIASRLPRDLGIETDFTELKVMIFPPGISIQNPRLRLAEGNALELPAGSSVRAERLDLTFRPVQMFSRDIRVHEITLWGGDVRLSLGEALAAKRSAKKKPAKPELRWDELFRLHAEAVSLVDTRIHVESSRPAFSVDMVAENARVAQWGGPGGLGYELALELANASSSYLKGLPVPATIDHIGLTARLNVAGLELERARVEAAGAELTAQGRIKGDLLDFKASPQFSGELEARGDLARYLAAIAPPGGKPPVDAAGVISIKAKAGGAIDRPLETIRASGTIAGEQLRFAEWSADSLQAQAGWQASPRGGELSVSRLEIAAKEQERMGGSRPGGGGRVTAGAFKIDLASLSARDRGDETPEIQVPLQLEHAHLHWLAAGALRQVYPLDLRVTGPVALRFRPGAGAKGAKGVARSWELGAKVGFDIERFQLDNQHLGQNKPLFKVLSIPKIRLDASVAIDRSAVRISDAVVSSGKATRFVGGGKVDFKTGLDLSFSGSTDLSDVGQIAENDIRGSGDVDVHVGGPLSAVQLEFEPALADASYLKLDFGSIQDGRITWDDGHDQLLITGIEAERGKSTYSAEGVIDVGKGKDTVDLSVRVPIGDVQDMAGVFGNLTRDIWWFPRGLSGPLHGDARVTGGLSLDKLVVSARVNGSDWQQWGERFASVQLQGGYDRGKYQITDFNAVKRTGRVSGRISYDADRVLDWAVRTEALTLADLDHVAQLDVPLRGRLTVESSGKGREGALLSSSTARVDDFVVRGVPMPPSELTVRTEGGRADVRGVALGGQGKIEASYDFKPGARSSIRAEARQLDFSPALLMLNSRLIQDRQLRGDISGSVDLSFASGRIERSSGKIELGEYHLAKTGSRFELSHPVSVQVADGSFDLADLSVRGPEGEATLALRSDRSELEGSVTGEVDASIVGFLTPALQESEGTAVLDFSLGGRIKEPTVFGKATFDGAMARVSGLESPFENCAGTLQLRQNVVSIQNVEADLAGGRVTADGTVELFTDRYPRVSIKSQFMGNKLKIYPFQFVKIRGGLDIHGDDLPYLVDGDLKVDSALSTEKVLAGGKGDALKAIQYAPPPSRAGAADYPKFKLNIRVAADGGVMIRNDLFNAEARGKLTVVNTIETPRLLGSAELIAGKLLFKDREFQIQSSSAVFDNPTVLNPSITLAANTDVSGTKIQLYASGRLPDNWKIELSSNPVMPEPEIISLLATGMTSSDARKLSASDRTSVEQGEAASLLLNSLDFNRDIQAKTGFQFNIDESSAPQQGTSVISKPQVGVTDSIAQPKIVIKRRIGSRFELSYGQTVSNSSTYSAKEVTGEYHFTNSFSALGVFDNYETADAPHQNSFGADLKFQTRFK